jgi:predicted HTH domain antitoxin
MTQLHINCPDEVTKGQTPTELARLAQHAFMVRLYQLGQISSGRAAEILNISRREFLEVLADHGVSIFDVETDVEAEARRGR